MRPIVPFLHMPENGKPYLSGCKCSNCGEVFVGERVACANCGAREGLEPIKLAGKGELYAYTVIYRSFPGIKTPYVSAVVDLEDGATLKGNLINIEPDPKAIEMGMPVEIVFQEAGIEDAEGTPCFGYFFQPANAEA